MIDEKKGGKLCGILLIALFSFTAFHMARWGWVKSLSFSPLIVGIILGMIYANTLRSFMPDSWSAGLKPFLLAGGIYIWLLAGG